MGHERDALLGIRVVDMSRVLAGPFCGMLLADMGAEVIKLELPGRGDDSREFPPFKDGASLYYINLNRGKKSLTLNLKNAEGKRLFLELVKRCDVLVENFSPGTMERLGLGYQELQAVNPQLIYAAISGFGQTGPYRNRPGYDIIGQAMGGLLSITGWPDSPPTRSGTAIGDILSSLFVTIGIMSALNIRERTGRGQMVDVSLVDSVYAALENIPQKYFVEGLVPQRIGNRYEFIYPYDTFMTKDGWVVIAVANDQIWSRFLETTGLTKLRDDQRFQSNKLRVDNHDALRPIIEKWTMEHNREEVVSKLNENRIPSCPIYDIKDASEDPHISKARGMVVDVEQPGLGMVKLQGNPIKMSETNPMPRGPAPSLGGDSEAVLMDLLGLSCEEVSRLRVEGII
ncbi:MAG: CaiB/BaiF CoA-transferase family protein [Candidatus Bathyarchaeota archaeon]|nr:CaiB/BaiF CoA-transferase family protein [Candidatus Bathyarchaeota archaeon]